MSRPVQTSIEQLLRQRFEPVHMEVINESHMHSVPPNSETHFKVVLVSDVFDGKRQVQRHQAVYAAVTEPMAGPVHALALHTYSPEEWREAQVPDSPNCLGGGGK